MDVSTAKKKATHKMVYKDGISNVMDKGLCHYLQSKDPINTSMPFLMASFINHKLIKKMLIKIVKIVLGRGLYPN